jgi:aryl-alcohol dehydrogenase-like predicted oxidoreductase
MPFAGHATPEGTTRYQARLQGIVAEGHFRNFEGLKVSSIGLGTYLGPPDAHTDAQYREAIVRAIECGCNLIDTAINYRFQQSERALGQALATLFQQGRLQRDEVVIATKGGYLPFDGGPPQSERDFRAYLEEVFIRPGVITYADLVDGSHCMTPAYLQHQLGTSLRNLGLECVDIYYVHNPEAQLSEIPRAEFLARMRLAFQALEQSVAGGKAQWYGTATWNGYRQPQEAQDHLSLAELQAAAQEIAGAAHRCKVIQLPHNLAMPEALTLQNQHVDGQSLSTLEAAEVLGVYTMVSASILQSQLAQRLPPVLAQVFGLDTSAQRALQFVRSSPGVGSALVGMKQLAHVEENLAVAKVPPAPFEQFMQLFQRS